MIKWLNTRDVDEIRDLLVLLGKIEMVLSPRYTQRYSEDELKFYKNYMPEFIDATERQYPPELERVRAIYKKLDNAIGEMKKTATATTKRAMYAKGGRRRKTRTLNPHHPTNKSNKSNKSKSRRGVK
jgi:hypothetical protein